MSSASKADRRYTNAKLGRTSTSAVRRINLQKKRDERLTFFVSAPSTRSFRSWVEAGLCPFCGDGPFVVLAQHTAKAHATSGVELRALAGLPATASITPPEYRADRAEAGRRTLAKLRADRPEVFEQMNQRRTSPPITGTCAVCETQFSYLLRKSRRKRTLCDSKSCLSEWLRRAQANRWP